MEHLIQYGLFLAKSMTIVIAGLFLMGGVVAISRKPKPKLSVTPLNKEYQDMKQHMEKELKIKTKKPKKKEKKEKASQHNVFVLTFEGDMKANQVEQLRDEITALLTIATPKDEVVLRLESPGGSVSGYGLAAAQLQRIRDRQIPLTVCIDKVAASGGYLMACVANQIIAAPFAILGSIGVVAQMPNFHKWLKKNSIDVELLTAGEYKRTLTVFGENTTKGREKFQEDLEDIHRVFKNYILKNRGNINIDEISTGEHWLAQDAMQYNLVDKLQTSDDYLLSKIASMNLYQVKIHAKPSLITKMTKPAMQYLHSWY